MTQTELEGGTHLLLEEERQGCEEAGDPVELPANERLTEAASNIWEQLVLHADDT